MQALKAQDQSNIFQFTCIQRIIDYKWLAYSKNYFIWQFYLFVILTVAFYVSLYFEQSIIEEELKSETLTIAGYDFGD